MLRYPKIEELQWNQVIHINRQQTHHTQLELSLLSHESHTWTHTLWMIIRVCVNVLYIYKQTRCTCVRAFCSVWKQSMMIYIILSFLIRMAWSMKLSTLLEPTTTLRNVVVLMMMLTMGWWLLLCCCGVVVNGGRVQCFVFDLLTFTMSTGMWGRRSGSETDDDAHNESQPRHRCPKRWELWRAHWEREKTRTQENTSAAQNEMSE